MRLHRLLGIMMLLESRGNMKAMELAKILETSERTIYRDIDILCESGIPIVSISGRYGGYSFMEGYKAKMSDLESKDVMNLLLSSIGIMPGAHTAASQELKNAFIKLENSIPKEYQEEMIKAKERFCVDTTPWWGEALPEDYVEIIKHAVLKFRKIKISYKKYRGEASQRVIRPYGVVVKHGDWYLIGFCENREEVRVFKCSRIEQLEVLEETFNPPKHFDLLGFWELLQNQFKEGVRLKSKSQGYVVKISCLKEIKDLFEGFEVLNSIKKDNKWYYTVDLLSFETAKHIIFPLCDEVEVLDPIAFRGYILEKISRIQKLYKIN